MKQLLLAELDTTDTAWLVGAPEAVALHPELLLSGTSADCLDGAADMKLSSGASPEGSRFVSVEVTAAAVPLTFGGIAPKKSSLSDKTLQLTEVISSVLFRIKRRRTVVLSMNSYKH